MNVFELRRRLVSDYEAYASSFIHIRDEGIRTRVEASLAAGSLWPEPLIQLNPSFESGESIDELVAGGELHEECRRVFRIRKGTPEERPLRLHRHQAEALRSARSGANYVLTTGTGSGKSLAYIVPAVDHVLRNASGRGIQAIVVYPMNALANSQHRELTKFLRDGYPDGRGPVTFARYTGQESDEDKQQIIANPPDILLTNYVMLELILTRPQEEPLIGAARGLRFLVLDELHTYRGRQGADVALLARRTRDRLDASSLQCVGTSATLASQGTQDEQRAHIATVASRLFGSEVRPENVIGETLRRATPARDPTDPEFRRALTTRVADASRPPPRDYSSFVQDPVSIWIESTFGITAEVGTGRLIRSRPKGISSEQGAARELVQLTGLPEDRCVAAIQEGLLAGYECEPHPETGYPVFAFRLHQFFSRGDTVFSSLEREQDRHATLQGQQFVPGDRSRVLLPLVFCRECGQEYYCVRRAIDPQTNRMAYEPRELSDRLSDAASTAGFLHTSSTNPWPLAEDAVIAHLPEDWLEEYRGKLRVRPNRREDLPQPVRVGPDGRESGEGLPCHFVGAPFRFCLECGVAYNFRQSSDFGKLATLGSDGRSMATTILSLSAIRHLRADPNLSERAKKLLSFTDNRQDASLQAGHFNDFVEVGLLRSALYRACFDGGPSGLRHEVLTQRVFDALNLPLDHYGSDPSVRFQALADTQRALRDVLGYRLYLDLRRGWRVTSPNLEQCGLLKIEYLSLDDVCRADDIWRSCHPALATARPETRLEVARTLLDFMRRELAMKVDYLTSLIQERIQQQSNQRLIPPWAIDENETPESACILFPRSSRPNDYGGNVYLSPRGGFGSYLRRRSTFEDYQGVLTLNESQTICVQLLEALRTGGLVEAVMAPRDANDVPGYQLVASAMLWTAGDGTRPFHDPIRVPNASAAGGRTNPFFIDFYRTIAAELRGRLEAREHTAQVDARLRQEREDEFREAKLPILYCSPTMELGVDIAELNAVNLRNIPPTPANYAQRSGRAGRSGQPALVFSYCATGSPHDQYFFKRPHRMVAGAVTPPRLDLANEDLVRAHVDAIWLAETGLSLGTSIKDLLDLSRDAFPLQDRVLDAVRAEGPRRRARERALRVLGTIGSELAASGWWSEGWLDEILTQAARSFDLTCERWRTIYRAALAQQEAQNRIIRDATRSAEDKAQANRLRKEAEAQLHLLTETDNVAQSDFYSYRYFASEGFLPGYNFPRLPLSAFIPGRRGSRGKNDFLSRPRFLAISEFGPRAIVYHEGSRYLINKVILPVGDEGVLTTAAKKCVGCGYLHPIAGGEGPDLCERCGVKLPLALKPLFRLQNVSTRRRDKINSDEEVRLRLGYEIRTAVRFAEHGGRPSFRLATVRATDGAELATLTYGHAANLWRVNLGWSRRADPNQHGFVLDVERGYWSKNDADASDGDGDPMSARTQRVIPYVEDRRNCLLIHPARPLEASVFASLAAALKRATQVEFELEENELIAEPLPDPENRQTILIYEAAEGGAGVLRRLVDEPDALRRVAREALDLCHFDRENGTDQRRAPGSREDCEAACYDCLMSYGNQGDHTLLDRQAIRDMLLTLASASVEAAPGERPRGAHLDGLARQAASDLERRWLTYVQERGLRLPSRAQVRVEACRTRPDFFYDESQTAIYVDGPHHQYPDRRERDRTQSDAMEDAGYTVIRFGAEQDWAEPIARYPHVFGRPSS